MVITASDARARLFPLIEQVNQDSTSVVITSKNGNAVLISQSEYESMMEMLYLMQSPPNRMRLNKSIADAKAGKTKTMTFPITLPTNKLPRISSGKWLLERYSMAEQGRVRCLYNCGVPPCLFG